MTLEVIAILLTVVVHFLGAAILVMVVLDGEKIDWRGTLFPRDDDGRGPGFEPPPEPIDPSGGGVAAPTPLPQSSPPPIRLREPGRISEGHPRPARRPAHAPERTPQREPSPR